MLGSVLRYFKVSLSCLIVIVVKTDAVCTGGASAGGGAWEQAVKSDKQPKMPIIMVRCRNGACGPACLNNDFVSIILKFPFVRWFSCRFAILYRLELQLLSHQLYGRTFYRSPENDPIPSAMQLYCGLGYSALSLAKLAALA